MPLPLVPIIIGVGAGWIGYDYFNDETVNNYNAPVVQKKESVINSIAVAAATAIAAYYVLKK